MKGIGRRLTEEEARRIWQRAAELQAQAADSEGRGTMPVPTEPAEGRALEDVTAAAVEAGIGAEYVQAALAELATVPTVGFDRTPLMKIGRTIVGEPFDAIEAARTITADPEMVYAALQRVFTAPPFGLVLTDSLGTDPLVDGVLVFDAEAPTFGQTPFQSRLNLGDVKRVYVTLRRTPDADARCRVHVRAPFERRRLNLFLSGVFTGTGGTAGAGIGIATSALLGVAGAAMLVLPGACLALGALGGNAGYRALYRWGVRQGQRALDQLLGALAADVRLRLPVGRNELPPAEP